MCDTVQQWIMQTAARVYVWGYIFRSIGARTWPWRSLGLPIVWPLCALFKVPWCRKPPQSIHSNEPWRNVTRYRWKSYYLFGGWEHMVRSVKWSIDHDPSFEAPGTFYVYHIGSLLYRGKRRFSKGTRFWEEVLQFWLRSSSNQTAKMYHYSVSGFSRKVGLTSQSTSSI